MAFVGVKVDEKTKELWLVAAEGAGMSLSAWLKQAAAERLRGQEVKEALFQGLDQNPLKEEIAERLQQQPSEAHDWRGPDFKGKQ